MSRTWRTERKTPKEQVPRAPTRPRMGEFAEEWYKDHGYTTSVAGECHRHTVTVPISVPFGCHTPGDCMRDCACGSAQGYLEADS